MIKSETKLTAWGQSIGIVLPKEALKEEKLNVNDEVEVIVRKRTNPLKDVFGKLKGVKPKTNKSTDELLKEIDKELDSKYN